MAYQTLDDAGPSAPVIIPTGFLPLPPLLAAIVAAGSTLAYQFEGSIDAPQQDGTMPSTATWFPLPGTATGLDGTQAIALAASASAVRIKVTSFTCGSVAFGARIARA